MTKGQVLKIDERDNVYIALADLKSGEQYAGIVLQNDIPQKHKFLSFDVARREEVIMYCMQEAVKRMEAKGGSIINMSSIAAHVGITDRLAYSMSKGALHAMTLSVARDFIDKNIRCNSISPARVHTPFVDGFLAKNYEGSEAKMFNRLSKSQPIGRMGKPDEIAAIVLYLCSEEASFVTGSDFPIDGGFVTLNN